LEDELISIVIADDEELVREGMKSLLANEMGYQVVAEAENGYELLNKITLFHPQIVILDVRMPVMDGLTALERIRSLFPELKVIILSGYNDFPLLKKAIQLGAIDYLLKPCSLKELREVLERIRRTILQEEDARGEKERLENRLKSCSLAFLEKTFWQLLRHELSLHDLREKIGVLGIQNREVVVIAIAACSAYQVRLSMDDHQYKDFRFKVERNVEEILKQMKREILLILQDDDTDVLLVVVSSSPLSFSDSLLALEIENALRKKFTRKFLVACSRPVTLLELDGAYQQVISLLGQKIFFASKAQEESFSPIEPSLREEVRNLINRVRFGSKNMVEQKLEGLFYHLDRNRAESSQYAQLAFYVAEMAFQCALEERLSVPNTLNPFMQGKEIGQLHTRDDFFVWLKKYLEIIAQMFQGNSAGFSLAVRRCLEFLDEHYGDNIGLNHLARLVDLNPAYLSFLIKKETGKSFSEHLVERRMVKARDLLNQGNLNVSEVANRVGYENVRYFSEVFRKFEGVTPQQFRKRKITSEKKQKIPDDIKK